MRLVAKGLSYWHTMGRRCRLTGAQPALARPSRLRELIRRMSVITHHLFYSYALDQSRLSLPSLADGLPTSNQMSCRSVNDRERTARLRHHVCTFSPAELDGVGWQSLRVEYWLERTCSTCGHRAPQCGSMV